LVSGVIDTTYIKFGDFIVEYLCKFEFIFEKAFTCVSGAQMELLMKKNHKSKISLKSPFNFIISIVFVFKCRLFSIIRVFTEYPLPLPPPLLVAQRSFDEKE
jgi:hypothetical protein